MTKARKILSISPFFPPNKGGLSYHVYNINTNLIKQGFDVTVITTRPTGQRISASSDYPGDVIRLNSIFLPGWPYPTLRSVSIPIDLGLKINSIIKNGNFDIVHVHGHHFPISWIAINLAHKYGIPSVLTMHGIYALNPNVLGGKSRFEDLFNKYIFSRILSKTTAVIGVTNQATEYAKGFGNKSQKYFTISNGVNVSLFKENMNRKEEYRQKYHLGKEKTVIFYCGRFEKVKGVTELALAAKNLVKSGNTEVVLVGEGSLEPILRSIIGDTSGIHLFNWQPKDIIHELYIASDIFINPSRFEGLPLTIMEAMNAALHIVYTPIGGIEEILKDYSMKTMLHTVTADEIQKVLTNLISNFPVQEIDASLAYAHKFGWDDISIETSKVYSQCFNKKKHSG